MAGGDGKRLLPLTRAIMGDDRPKQFCSLIGGETLLQQTRGRVRQAIPDSRTLLILTQHHEPYYAAEVEDVQSSRLLIQPHNRGTAVAIAYCVTHLRRMDPRGVVAFFPSDHHFVNNEAFVKHIDFAFAQARSQPNRVILLGIEPEAPEEAYGWIEPGPPIPEDPTHTMFAVTRFWEKPCRTVATLLMHAGCLWNSFVMVGAVGGFIDLLQQTLPNLLAWFEDFWATTGPGMGDKVLSGLYLRLPTANFSQEVLSARPADLTVIRARGLGWTDLGDPARLLSMFPHRNFYRPR